MSNVSDGYTAIFSPGYYIKRVLTVRNIDQQDLAKELHINSEELTAILTDQKALDESLIHKLAAYFGTSTDLWRQLNMNFVKGLIKNK